MHFPSRLPARPAAQGGVVSDRSVWRLSLACIVCLIAFWSPLATAASASVTQRNVLVLYSNGRLLPANVEVDRALSGRFSARADLSVALDFWLRQRDTVFPGVSYLTQGTLRSSAIGRVPVAVGGRGDVVGSYDNARVIFLALNVNWKP